MELVTATRDNPLRPCCEAARGKLARALPTVSLFAGHGAAPDAPAVGYIIEGDCGCEPRFLAHDWRRDGHATFEAAP